MPFKDLDKRKAYDAEYKRTHRAEMKEYFTNYHLGHRDEKSLKAKEWVENNRWKHNITIKVYKQKLKDKVYELLGGYVCKHCGYTDIRALAIDHINNDGYKDRKAGRYLFKIIIDLPIDEAKNTYQVLCFNCNQIKKLEYERRKSYI